MAWIFLLFSLLSPGSASASRLLHIPPIHFHDWIAASSAWCKGGLSAGQYQRGLEIAILNVSSITQTVTITGNIVPGSAGAGIGGTSTAVADTYFGASGSSTSSLTDTKTFTVSLAPGQSSVPGFWLSYTGNETTTAGAYHITGEFDITFTVAEDKGAISASIDTNQEDTCVTLDSTQVAEMLRNVLKTYTVNGGRPF